MQRSKIALVVGVVSILAAATSCSRTPAQPSVSSGSAQLAATPDRLSQLDPFIAQAGDKTETFDESRARAGGLGEDTLRLGRELVALNNQIVLDASAGREFDGAREQYGLVNAAFQQIALDGLAGQSRLWIGCGNFIFPARCPVRVTSAQTFSTDAKVRTALSNLGYHYTASYAGQYGNDYTMTVANSCWPSSFRSQAIVTKSGSNWTYSTQSPEPNPEILSYIWPYTWWGAYVYWWHHWYC